LEGRRSVPVRGAVYKTGSAWAIGVEAKQKAFIMLKRLNVLIVATLTALTAGCLQKETTQTLYLAPDGSVSWVVAESNVRSNDTDGAKRLAEEQEYISQAILGTHGTARGLAALGPLGAVRTTVLRAERPFHVVTSAEFAATDQVLQRVFTEMAIETSASFVRRGDENTLCVRLDFSHPLEEHETPVSELMDSFERFRLVLTEGRIANTSGLDVTDGTSATLSEQWLERAERAYEAKSSIEFSLSWRVR
jgi:hypothetical protein